jgi:hypothetical protein
MQLEWAFCLPKKISPPKSSQPSFCNSESSSDCALLDQNFESFTQMIRMSQGLKLPPRGT